MARTGASIGVGAVPVVGTVQSVVEVISGRDYIEGTDVNRWVAGGGIIAGIIPGGKAALKGAVKGIGRFFRRAPRFPTDPGQVGHIFRNAPGHLADTPANRALISDVAADSANRLGTDRFGNAWSAVTRSDGSQVWVSTRDGVIQNAGVNTTPRVFNSGSGLAGQ